MDTKRKTDTKERLCKREGCGNTFVPASRKSRKKYCSVRCRRLVHEERVLRDALETKINQMLTKETDIREKYLKRS